MRVIILLVAWWMLAPLLFAQSSNKPVSLALVMENSAASLAGDFLTTELSGQETFQLLERTEIDKIYREQAVSVGNQNYLRLGQLLGADGLLLLKGVKEGDTEFLAVRLVAIKPGVVIRETRLPWHQAEALAEAKSDRHLLPTVFYQTGSVSSGCHSSLDRQFALRHEILQVLKLSNAS